MFPWTFTDDTVMGIAVTQTLEICGEVNQDDLAQRFGTKYAEDPHRGYGDTAHKILRAIASGTPWREVSPKAFGGSGSMGNGAAMRAAPVGAWFFDDPQQAAKQAVLNAEVTHMHIDGQAGAVAVAAALSCQWQIEGTAESNRSALMKTVLPSVPDSVTRNVLARALELPDEISFQEAAAELGSGEQNRSHRRTQSRFVSGQLKSVC